MKNEWKCLKSDDVEFKVGQTVTFKPYEKEFNLFVVGYDLTSSDEILYCLSEFDTGKEDTIITQTTGRCIKESRFFHESSV